MKKNKDYDVRTIMHTNCERKKRESVEEPAEERSPRQEDFNK